MPRLDIALYRYAVSIFGGTGISHVFPFSCIEKAFLRTVRSDVVEIDGHTLYLDKFDSLNLSACGTFEPLETEAVKSLVRPGGVVVDIGANIGYYTLLFARLAGESGKVYAFEPVPGNAELLKKNVAVNGYTNVDVHCAAVSDHTGTIAVFLASGNEVDHQTYEGKESRERIAAPCTRLDDFFRDRDESIQLIKMDIQGAEAAALRGMEAVLRDNPDVVLFMEFWPYGLVNAGADPEGVLQMLHSQGFELEKLEERSGRIVPASIRGLVQEYTYEKQNFTNLLCRRARSPHST